MGELNAGRASGQRERRASGRWLNLLILLLVTAAACGLYLVYSLGAGGVGFPLDDAWIHQTYARNLGLHGEWAFLPGQPSAGSTAPLWTAVLALGHWLRLGPYIGTYLIGWMLLWGLSAAGMWVFGLLSPAYHCWALAAGLLLALEWHLVWAGVSGMETLLSALIILCALGLLLTDPVRWLWLGILVGLSAWVRPDGVTLLGPALFVIAIGLPDWARRGRAAIRLLSGWLVAFLPYLLFNQSLGGAWWPNTFFAKQAEYAVELQASLWSRLAEQGAIPLVGVGVLLLPGFLYTLARAIRQRNWVVLAGGLWLLGYLAMYALRLPVSYQHGRYVMPALPVYFIWGLVGVFEIAGRPAASAVRRVLGRAWLASTPVVLVIFLFMGASAYRRDVALIESEMVTTARWVAAHIPPEALVAAHDIGALGYFGERRLLDLAGLVSPEVIPFIRDETRLAAYLTEQGAAYLVTFPGWYPELVNGREVLFTSGGMLSTQLGGENMAVYRWQD